MLAFTAAEAPAPDPRDSAARAGDRARACAAESGNAVELVREVDMVRCWEDLSLDRVREEEHTERSEVCDDDDEWRSN